VLSPTTAAADRGVKLQLSAKYGVPHYWIVDPDARIIETYRLAGPSYEPGPGLDGPTPVALPPFPTCFSILPPSGAEGHSSLKSVREQPSVRELAGSCQRAGRASILANAARAARMPSTPFGKPA
jgi:hypothetical protein